MLPPNATLVIQPLYQGIIAMVKARYRKWYLNWLLKMDHRATMRHNMNFMLLDMDSDPDDSAPVLDPESPLQHLKPSVCRRIRHISEIWQSVESQHIQNCWRKAGIVPEEWTPTLAQHHSTLDQLYEQLQPLIARIEPAARERLSQEEYVNAVPGENEREPVNSF